MIVFTPRSFKPQKSQVGKQQVLAVRCQGGYCMIVQTMYNVLIHKLKGLLSYFVMFGFCIYWTERLYILGRNIDELLLK